MAACTVHDTVCMCSRIIEVEPSVNINEGRGGDIVKVLDNRIIGKVDQRPRDKEEGGERGGRRKTGLD